MFPEQLPYNKVVSVLELLRAYVQVFARTSYALGFNFTSIFRRNPEPTAKRVMLNDLKALRDECERLNLEMTYTLIDEFIHLLKASTDKEPILLLHENLNHICDDLQRELSLQLFIRIRSEHRKKYDDPFKGWEDIVTRFPETVTDIEEMNKCFALCRYTAAMYHAMQIAEGGAIALGDYIGVTDPRKGWGPTEKKLNQIIKDGHAKLPATLAGKFEFLEQMNREIDSMVLAWRHKLDHAANHLAISPNTTFAPDIAEHIMGAVRVFMIRLMAGMT